MVHGNSERRSHAELPRNGRLIVPILRSIELSYILCTLWFLRFLRFSLSPPVEPLDARLAPDNVYMGGSQFSVNRKNPTNRKGKFSISTKTINSESLQQPRAIYLFSRFHSNQPTYSPPASIDPDGRESSINLLALAKTTSDPKSCR